MNVHGMRGRGRAGRRREWNNRPRHSACRNGSNLQGMSPSRVGSVCTTRVMGSCFRRCPGVGTFHSRVCPRCSSDHVQHDGDLRMSMIGKGRTRAKRFTWSGFARDVRRIYSPGRPRKGRRAWG